MSTCKILVIWNFTNESGSSPVFADGSNLFTTLFDTNNNKVVDNNNNWGFNDYISQGECANFTGSDDYKNKGPNSCKTEYRRPLDNTKWYVDSTSYDGKKKVYDNGKDAYNAAYPYFGECNNSSYGRYACLDIKNMPAPMFETGSTYINPESSLTWAISTDVESWGDGGLWEDARKYNLIADYKVDNINKLYVSEKFENSDSNTTLFKIDISNDKTILYNTPWKFLLNPTEDNSNLTDIFEKVQFWVSLDNDTQSKYILEPECWGPDNPCSDDNGDDDNGDDDNGGDDNGNSPNKESSSNSLAIILISTIGGFFLLLLIILIIFLLLPDKKPAPTLN